MRKLFLFIILAFLYTNIICFAQNEQIHVWIGTPNMIAHIGEQIIVPIQVSSTSQNLSLSFAHIPIATDNICISERNGGSAEGPFLDWSDVSFLAPVYDTPIVGYTSESFLAFEDLGFPLAPFNPYPGATVGHFVMTVANDPSLIGQTRSVFIEGYSPIVGNGTTFFGGCDGVSEYRNILFTFYPITFVGSYSIGDGIGVMNNQQNHVDTYATGLNNYRLEDYTRRAITNPHNHNGQMLFNQSIHTFRYAGGYPGNEITDTDNHWNSSNQPEGVDAQVYGGMFYDYLLSSPYGLNSFNGNGTGMIMTVESTLGSDNAYFDDQSYRVVFYDASSGHRSWAGCLESIAHEWSHGISVTHSNMPYEKESGSLEESFGNMMGATTRYHYTGIVDWALYTNANSSGLPIYRMDYTHNDVQHPLEYPTQDSRPDFYNDPVDWFNHIGCTPTSSNDYCGVHKNSGVPDKMFSLLSSGGTSLHNGVAVQGIGIENAMKIMMYANIHYWNSNTTTFKRARRGVIESARVFYNNRDWAIQAANAWNAVGVCDDCVYVPGDANHNGITNGIDVTYMASVLKGNSPPLNTCTLDYGVDTQIWSNFYAAADWNGNCEFNGIDVTYATNYFKGREPDIKWCPHFTPGTP